MPPIEPGGLGLKPRIMPADHLFLATATPEAESIVAEVTTNHALFRPPLNQGSEGTCVGHGCQYHLEAAPIIQVGRRPIAVPNAVALSLYDESYRFENGLGPEAPVDRSAGLFVDSAMHVCRSRGIVKEWRHALNPDDVIRMLAGVDANGKKLGTPILLGIPWFSSMDRVPTSGIITVDPGSGLRGYHCVCLLRYNKATDRVSFPNSWGTLFGHGGWGSLSRRDLYVLFDNFGHGIIARETRKAA